MTEARWLSCTDPGRMLVFVRRKLSDRKLRLFAVACCRRIAGQFTHPAHSAALDCAERFAEGHATEDELFAAIHAIEQSAGPPEPHSPALHGVPSPAAYAVMWAAACGEDAPFRAAERASQVSANAAGRADERQHQADLLRCLAGNPFRTPAPPPVLSDDVRKLAAAIYAEGNFADLPVLADALEDAGCTNEEALAHLRGPGPHARGCWVLDLVLGRA